MLRPKDGRRELQGLLWALKALLASWSGKFGEKIPVTKTLSTCLELWTHLQRQDRAKNEADVAINIAICFVRGTPWISLGQPGLAKLAADLVPDGVYGPCAQAFFSTADEVLDQTEIEPVGQFDQPHPLSMPGSHGG